jgi:hypothetical protein
MVELLGENEFLSLEDFLVWTVTAHLPQVLYKSKRIQKMLKSSLLQARFRFFLFIEGQISKCLMVRSRKSCFLDLYFVSTSFYERS